MVKKQGGFIMKKITKFLLSMLVAFSLVLSNSALPVMAENTITTEERDMPDEIILSDGTTIKIENTNNFIRYFVPENNGTTTIVEENKKTGEVLVNGRNVFTDMSTMIEASQRDNWGAPSVEKWSMNVAGMSIVTIATAVAAKSHNLTVDKIAKALKKVGKELSKLYYKSILQLNYVDYSPKVGYRLTEELYTSSSYSVSSRICQSTMSGSR